MTRAIAVIGSGRKSGKTTTMEALEFDFMAHLCRHMSKKLNSGEEIKDDLAIQREFLDEGLSKWVPEFCDDVIKSSESDFYRGIAQITKGFLAFDSSMMDEISAMA